MKLLSRLFAAAALAAAIAVAAPPAAQAQWWNMGGWYGTGVFNDYAYYPNYNNYYDTDFAGGRWSDWW